MTVYQLLKRCGVLDAAEARLTWVKGHSCILHNESSHMLSMKGRQE
jgi:hypothetical protein